MDYSKKTNAELDMLVAEKIMGWKKIDSLIDENGVYLTNIYQDKDGNNLFAQTRWHPTTDYNQIFGVGGVVEKMTADGWFISMKNNISKDWNILIWKYGTDDFRGIDKSLPRAICIAALKAVENAPNT